MYSLDCTGTMFKLTRIHIRRIFFSKQQFIRTVSINSTVVKRAEEQVKVSKPWHEIPGPLSLPIVGQLLHFLPGGWLHNRTIELQELLYKNYGPIVRLDGNLGLQPITFIFDPEAGRNLFRKEELMPTRPGFDSVTYHRKNFFSKKDINCIGLIFDQGDAWKKFRSMVNPVMLQPKTIKLYANVMTEVAEDMIKRIRQIRNEDNSLNKDIFMEFNLWALESVAVVALGGRLNCFDPNLPEDSPVKKLIKTIHEVFNVTEKLDFQPSLWKYFATAEFNKAMKIYDNHMKLQEFFIDKAVDQLKHKKQTNDEDKSVLEKLLEIDRNVAVIMANDMLFAGVDTAASTTLGLLYLLATNPEKQNKLREEIKLKQDKRTYIKACIKESLRIHPVVNGNFRQTTKEYDVLGYNIPKDMCIIVGNQAWSMMEEQFPRPTEFIPERWIADKNDPLYYGNAHPFAYAPFGVGVRSCIGRRIAELELETFCTKIIENFQLEWIGPPPKRTRTGAINYFLGPYHFIFKDL